MRAISFKNTALFKRGVWLTALALLAFVAAPSALDGDLWRNPLPSAIAMGLLAAALTYFFWKTQLHRLADEVLDCQDSLKVRRGRLTETIPLSNVAVAEVMSGGGLNRITLRLRERSPMGRHIDFLPQASLWSNLPAIRSLALELTERANDARALAVLKL
ncbi:MAG TPA: hypothetical protein VK794_16380 [Steroidobacteraceae bacterium]|jgi:hypothetical protein|nr:hypothetical protein [Steroidobacteraceae bacterium]